MPPPTQGSTPQSKPQAGGSLLPTLKSLADYEPSDEIKAAVAQYHAVGKNPNAWKAGLTTENPDGPGKPTG